MYLLFILLYISSFLIYYSNNSLEEPKFLSAGMFSYLFKYSSLTDSESPIDWFNYFNA